MPDFRRIDAPTATWYAPPWPELPGLVAGFTSRRWRPTLDVDWRDDWSFRRPPDDSAPPGLAHLIAETQLEGLAIVGEQQVHEDTISTVRRADIADPSFHLVRSSDALLLPEPGCIGLAQAADCAIGLVVAPERRLAALFHAGWRGAVLGLPAKLVRTLAADHGIAAETLLIAVAPCIQPTSFQVGPEVARQFSAWSDRLGQALVVPDPAKPNRWRADLPGLVRAQLVAEGVAPERLTVSALDTVTNPELLFSYRRDGAGMGLQVGFCGWRDAG